MPSTIYDKKPELIESRKIAISHLGGDSTWRELCKLPLDQIRNREVFLKILEGNHNDIYDMLVDMLPLILTI